jgi:hypothetical protein
MMGKTEFSPSRSHVRSYCYFSGAVIFIDTYQNMVLLNAQKLITVNLLQTRQIVVGIIAHQALPDWNIIVMKLKGKVSSPSRSIVKSVIFITAAVIFICVAALTVQRACQFYKSLIKTIG